MSDRTRRQNSSNSRSLNAPQSFYSSGPSSSRPFLNMLNPMMSRTYQGYTQANQSLVEEEEEMERNTDDDLEAGRSQSTIFQTPREPESRQKSAWDAGASEMNTLHPNIHRDDVYHERESSDDEVPQSFMIEAASPRKNSKGKSKDTSSRSGAGRSQPLLSVPSRKLPPILPTTARQPLPSSVSTPPRPADVDTTNGTKHTTIADGSPSHLSSDANRQPKRLRGLDEYEKALWHWVNVYNLDEFLQDVYSYYEGKGIYSIALSRGLNLLTVGFVIGFSTFLLGCVDYSLIRHQKVTQLSDVVVSRCISRFSGFTLLFFILFLAFYVWQIVAFVLGIMRLVDMYNFYTYLLKIPDADIQTISWPEIVRRIGSIREENPLTAISSKSRHSTNNPSTAKLDAHDIANRIMRKENYLIALFNKELLDLRVPLPALFRRFMREESGKGRTLTQALEWNIRFCLMEYLFDNHGRVRKVFLKSKNRAALIEGLKRRFIFMGILNAIFAPFIVLYLLMYSFFRYFEEYHKDPSSIGGRRYTSFARWKFREFNELPHLFTRRLDESYPIASMYIGQFPNEKITIIMRFVAFIAGSFAAVLVLATVLDPDLFFHFEITPHRTVVFYLGVFGAILTAARGMIPEENRVFDSELLMMDVIAFTHYMPDDWKGQLHSKKVHQEFGELFAMKVLIFIQELLSVVLTPFVLWFSLPECAPAIIDFFREFTVHVEGRGYVCSFAEFNFERHGNVKFGAPKRVQDKRMLSKEGKMEKSFLNFKAANPDWNPSDPSGSLYLSRMADLNVTQNLNYPYSARRRPGVDGAVHFASEPRVDGSLTDKIQEYDRALRHSQYSALSRRKGQMAGSLMSMSTLAKDASSSSVFGGVDTAQTAVLGDSQGSIRARSPAAEPKADVTPSDDHDLDGGIVSGLGESYVDGARRAKTLNDAEEEQDDEIRDAGVLSLLAQIYGRREGTSGVL